MKLFELNSSYMQELKDSALNLIYTASANGQDKIEMHDMISDLSSEGFYVTAKDLIQVLDGEDSIKTANAKEIELDTGINDIEGDMSSGAEQKDVAADTVSKLAQAQAQKGIQ